MLSKQYLIKQNKCCGNGCFMCPYLPRHSKGSNKIMNQMGYACINMELSNSKPRVTTNRSMIKRTFTEKGLPYASELALQNCKDLLTILKWNNDNGFKFFYELLSVSKGVLNIEEVALTFQPRLKQLEDLLFTRFLYS